MSYLSTSPAKNGAVDGDDIQEILSSFYLNDDDEAEEFEDNSCDSDNLSEGVTITSVNDEEDEGEEAEQLYDLYGALDDDDEQDDEDAAYSSHESEDEEYDYPPDPPFDAYCPQDQDVHRHDLDKFAIDAIYSKPPLHNGDLPVVIKCHDGLKDVFRGRQLLRRTLTESSSSSTSSS